MKKTIITYSAILLLLELLGWWVFFYSPFNIPTHIPNTPINISGLFLIILFTVVIVRLHRKILKLPREKSFSRLVVAGCLVAFLSKIVFQSIRFSSIAADTWEEKLYLAFRGVIVMSLMALVISLISAFLIKRKPRSA